MRCLIPSRTYGVVALIKNIKRVGCILSLLTTLTINGCAGLGPQGPKKLNSRQTDALAETVMSQSGSTAVIVAASQYGPGQATLGENYLSALGLPCRRVFFVANTGEHRHLTVCAEKDGVWVTAPDIFAEPETGGAKIKGQ